jgi:protein-ribulosamine 3-kinase
LHLDNEIKSKKSAKRESWITKNDNKTDNIFVNQFGFDVTTCCGFIPLNNEWCDNWVNFYARNRLEHQIRLIESNYGDRELNEYWSHLQLKLSEFFKDIENSITPALLHGDLWGGNAAQLAEEPVVYDPSSFYGHSEFELSISKMFGGFNRAFYDSYHAKIPKVTGYERYKLSLIFYLLFYRYKI